jgi:pimeloyl-ACP methyl ester carboxylesterase
MDVASLSVDGPQGLLSHLAGEPPTPPSWFARALEHAPERRRIVVDGAGLELLTWGGLGKPGLLLLHGNGAHADWWSFLAPMLADHYRVAALTWSGMGGSDWRDSYSFAGFRAEMLAAIEAGGLEAGGEKPLVAAHSFGGFIAMYAAATLGARFKGVALIDAAVAPPEAPQDGPPARFRPNRVYSTFDQALGRFRLAPPQPCENLFAIDHIARLSIKPTEGGFTWKFDPFLWRNFADDDAAAMLANPQCPIALVWGARSNLMTPASRGLYGACRTCWNALGSHTGGRPSRHAGPAFGLCGGPARPVRRLAGAVTVIAVCGSFYQ